MILKPTKFRLPIKGHWGTKGLVGCWLMNEGGGARINDYSGQYPAMASGTIAWIPGKFGSAFNFDGSTSFLAVGKDIGLSTGTFTIIAWVNPTSVADYYGIIGGSGTSYPGFGIYGGGSQQLFLAKQGVDWIGTSGLGNTISANVWSQVGVTYDGTTYQFIINGRIVKTAVNAFTFTSRNTEIGRYSTSYWPGAIDHILIYNRVLSSTQIAQLCREPFCMFERERIELWSAAMAAGPAPPLTSSVFGSLLMNAYTKRKLHKVGMFAQI